MKIVLVLVMGLLLIGCNDEKSDEAQVEITHSIDKVSQVVKEESVNITKNLEQATEDNVQTIKKEVKNIDKPNVPEVLVEKEKSNINVAVLFTKCSGCHGVKADKKALNKSQSIKGWSVIKLTDAIHGYKDGSYGGSMKGVMKAQVNKLSSNEIKALAEYISKL